MNLKILFLHQLNLILCDTFLQNVIHNGHFTLLSPILNHSQLKTVTTAQIQYMRNTVQIERARTNSCLCCTNTIWIAFVGARSCTVWHSFPSSNRWRSAAWPAVSYTHLDVYKRQGLNYEPKKVRTFGLYFCIHMACSIFHLL